MFLNSLLSKAALWLPTLWSKSVLQKIPNLQSSNEGVRSNEFSENQHKTLQNNLSIWARQTWYSTAGRAVEFRHWLDNGKNSSSYGISTSSTPVGSRHSQPLQQQQQQQQGVTWSRCWATQDHPPPHPQRYQWNGIAACLNLFSDSSVVSACWNDCFPVLGYWATTGGPQTQDCHSPRNCTALSALSHIVT
jgi:hypothetical protein